MAADEPTAGSGTTAATATASLKDGSRRSKQCGLQAMESQRMRPFAIDDGLGKRCGRVRPWEQASRCRPTYLTRFICTVVEASHRGGGGGLRRDIFCPKASRCKFSRDLSPVPPWRGLTTEAAARSREDNDWMKRPRRVMFCMSRRRKSPAIMSPIAWSGSIARQPGRHHMQVAFASNSR